MNDQEFAAWLRSLPRETPPEEAEAAELAHDVEVGPYVPHHHHAYYGEAGH